MPNYNDLFNMINEEINKCNVQKPAMVSWLTPDDRRIAESKPMESIENIKNPTQIYQFYFQYPLVNFHYFDHLKYNWI